MKTCTKCLRSLPHESFGKMKNNGPLGLNPKCKDCIAEWRVENKERIAAWNRVSRVRSYGIEVSDYDAMFVAQGGKCAICLTAEPGGRNSVFQIDHDHETGKVRGLLCWDCNIALGKMKDDPNRLMAAAAYLLQSADVLTLVREKGH